MSYKVQSIAVFEKQAKRLIKKYASLKNELLELVRELKENPLQGTAIGKSCYKIRVPIASKGKGKKRRSKDNHQFRSNRPNRLPAVYI